ncbi:hypothetical protein ACFWP7_28695 [Streptomyces sp. NPDC058470]|uniref:hypothetical protein n=1 Tax=Streptomyces sp. NPDC058470 TaxID=3346515 RepID=UPI00365D0C86
MTTTQFKRKRWHWIITIAWRKDRVWQIETADGDCGPLPGASRQELYNHLFNKIVKEYGAPEDARVVFFSLEPDELVPDPDDE